MKKSFLLVAGAILALQLFQVQPINAKNSKPANAVHAVCRVSEADVIYYLESKGYRNVIVLQIMSDGNYLCASDFPFNTIVFVQNGYITGYEDIG